MTTVKSVCPYCGVGCGIVMEVADNRVIKVTGDKQHPSNFGRLCTKGNTCAQALVESGRLEHAYVRQDRTQEPGRVEINSAIKEAARRLRDILDTHGPDAIALYVSGQMSIESQYLANKLVKGYLGSNNIESNSRLCMASAGSGYKLSLGSDGPPGSYEDFDKADVFFVIGANMADCHPILFLRMMDRVKAGARLIVVDPRRNTTADKANLFMQIKPGTDLALLNGLLHLLVKHGHTDPEFIAEFTEGWEVMPAFLEDYSPEKVAEITGLPEADIRQAAEWIGTAREWMSCWTMGLNQSTHGTWNTNAICNLHLATGAICRPGSGPFSLTGQPNAMGGREMGYMGPGLPGQRSVLVEQDRAFIENLWKIPADTLHTRLGGGTIAMFEQMKAGKIKACWIICTNPVASVANRKNVIEGLEAAELVITQDAFLDTETNHYADILLPGALWAEAEGVMINSERNMTLMQQAVTPPGEAMADWQIIARVACEMGFAEAFTYSSAAEVFEEIKQVSNPKTGYEIRGISHDKLRSQPLQWPRTADSEDERQPIRYINDGIHQKLKVNEDGSIPRIAFASESGKGVFFARPHVAAAEMPDQDFPLVLNTGRLQHQWHTMTKTGKIATLNKLNPGPFIELHPEDAAALDIRDKDQVAIRSRRGHAVLPAVVTDRVRPGNSFAPFHWNDTYGEHLTINAVTNDAIDPISQQPEFKVCAVSMTRVASTAHETKLQDGDNGALSTDTVAQPHVKELDMKDINALAKLLGLDSVPEITLDPQEQHYMQGYITGLRTEESRKMGGVPVLPSTAPLNPAKRMLVDGILAGMFARTWLSDDLALGIAAQSAVTVLWASQTGNAEAFATQCAARLQAEGHLVTLASMDSIQVSELANTSQLLLLTSTFGDGDPPDNAGAFWSALALESAPRLEQTQFAVLAFGDSNYDQFCGFGRKLDARLEVLGAQRLTARIDCEPEFEEPAQAWLEAVVQSMSSATVNASQAIAASALTLAGNTSDIPSETPITAPTYSRQQPLRTRLVINQRLNAADSEKEIRQFGFDLSNTDFHYEAGDALGVWPTNCPELVGNILSVLKLSPSSMVTAKELGELPLVEALSHHYDIARITPDVLKFVGERNQDPQLAALMTADNQAALKSWLWGKQIIDLLQAFPIAASATEWLAVLKRMQPRLYSISSSPKIHPGQVHLTVSTVRYGDQGNARGGVCSTFLADRAADAEIPIFLQKSAHFRIPNNPDAPLIMVGPGTGIAPFRAFLQERQATAATGKNWLFFGEQHADTDFYYREELLALQKAGYLHKFDTAFSRDQAEKIYVQHRMIEHGATLWAWLEEGAHFCVCGDASRMAKDVDAALKTVVQTHGRMSAEDAVAYVSRMAQDKRYVRDVY
ncbi:bifunctional nitrate reductase/sulfite reductase flavoprotein subunit alpha [Methylobacillus gramineus]|uniref:bifunctional nitrate reductase/sulfite reductase flavoprotein subunit alpha n=1 Tax=Methylobacillus gramineus TaxID=755169 RepID=UPI001CFF9B1B|nr:bifunctional nitrate reductase/sulfite reductase flavoprotein subunit alpha [Methylobacillus gramineus]MCB5185378.1 bifunctional nitrate reductase/sulfite reductase flavoprotein subunit alpha [Methylobacillus gramineus]